MNVNDLRVMVDNLPNGKQKQYFEDIVGRLENGEVLEASSVINGMDKEIFKDVDIEELKRKEQEANKIFKKWASQ